VLGPALSQLEWAFGKGSIMRLGKNQNTGPVMIEAIEPDAELFTLTGQTVQRSSQVRPLDA
jgi:hypothetical protein